MGGELDGVRAVFGQSCCMNSRYFNLKVSGRVEDVQSKDSFGVKTTEGQIKEHADF